MSTSTMPMPTATGSAGFLGLAEALVRPLVAMAQAFKSRRDMRVIAAFDDRMLADIGLTRGDLRDAVAEPLWRDPTAVLVVRVSERRQALRGFRGRTYQVVKAPPLAPRAPACVPTVSRAALPY